MVSHDVLLADDDDALRAALSEFLSRFGFGILEAADGAAALELAMVRDPAFSILDLHMPGMSGLEVLRALQRRRTGRLPCILLSAEASASERQEALARGAFRVLAKPFAPDHLLDTVAEVLRAFHPQSGLDHIVARLTDPRGPFPDIVPGSGLPVPLDLFSFFPGSKRHRPPDSC